jgi:MFS transporter, YNFM family, putative membrane transport protein
MDRTNFLGLQALVFSVVAAAFATVYITQPVLPVLRAEFGVSAALASLTVSAVVLGIALASLPFGMLVDRWPVRNLILGGGLVVATCGLVCASTHSLMLLIAARFLQGVFIPALTSCLAAYLARTLPLAQLNVVMGSYVSATVMGGLSGRMLGGWIHPPLHWRYAFVSASCLLLAATLATVRWLPKGELKEQTTIQGEGFLALLSRQSVRRILWVAFGSFFIFSSIFNYLPFYLAGPPFRASTEMITLLYLSYLVGVIIGPLAGRLSNRIGNGNTMILGTTILALALSLTLIASLLAIIAALLLVCAGFFSIHAAAVGALNRRLTTSQGRANSLYVLVYYLGGAIGITMSGYVYGWWGWPGLIVLVFMMLPLLGATGVAERRTEESTAL